jgi:hypothetical protein
LLSRTPRLFIEAKGLGENINDPKWANQTISYAAVAGVEWVALTDGAEWRVYNAHAPVPVEHKLFRAVRVAEDLDAAFELLALLSKDNMRDNRLQELWRGFFVDRQVYAALDKLFNAGEPARDLVTLVAKRVPDLSKADIRASLVRARVTFDFPTPKPSDDLRYDHTRYAWLAGAFAWANRRPSATASSLYPRHRRRATSHAARCHPEWTPADGESPRNRLHGPTPHRRAAC